MDVCQLMMFAGVDDSVGWSEQCSDGSDCSATSPTTVNKTQLTVSSREWRWCWVECWLHWFPAWTGLSTRPLLWTCTHSRLH